MREYHGRQLPVTTPIQTQVPATPTKAVPKFVTAPLWFEPVEPHPIYPTLGSAASSAPSMLSPINEEYQKYIMGTPSCAETDILTFWEVCTFSSQNVVETDQCLLFNITTKKHHRADYLILFDIALDYLLIQVSSVPCERVFSSAGETDTKKCNRISPILMESLQMLKYSYKKERLNFMSGWMVTTHEMMRKDNSDVLTQLLMHDSTETMDSLLRVLEADDISDNEVAGGR